MELLKGKRILLAEDNPVNVLVIKRFLTKYEVDLSIAINGKEAIDFLSKEEYDLMLLDLQMPLVDGYEVLQYIQKNQKTIPTIILSASEFNQIQNLTNEIKDTHFLTKPFTENNFLSKISMLIK